MTFFANHQAKRLCDVTFPGSHDAGINAGRGNVRTQSLNIQAQAAQGCRFFDIRVGAHKTGHGNNATYTAQTYHLDAKLVKDHGRGNVPHGDQITRYQTLRGLGGWGQSLSDILGQARAFVSGPAAATECVILKFSKCFNWKYIAEQCITELHLNNASVHYTGGGNLNTTTISALAGKVITLFPEDAYPEINTHCTHKYPFIQHGYPHGLMYFRELYSKDGQHKSYQQNPPPHINLQYFGKFSSTSNPKKNTKKQRETIKENAASHPNCLGMMYWTTTGLTGNIITRNNRMWTAVGRDALKRTWKAGLEESINLRVGHQGIPITRDQLKANSALFQIQAFMPNIVMIDDVDLVKCNTIQQLNNVPKHELEALLHPEPQQGEMPDFA